MAKLPRLASVLGCTINELFGRSPPEGGENVSDSEYLENTIKRIIEELKGKNCLSQDFCFLTKAERDKALDDFIDDFIEKEDHLDHQQNLSSHL